jgi:hypothetical protein
MQQSINRPNGFEERSREQSLENSPSQHEWTFMEEATKDKRSKKR